MIVYSSPNTGKSFFCKNNHEWFDADIELFRLFNEAFGIYICDDANKADKLLNCFKKDRYMAEKCYDKYLLWLKANRSQRKIMLGSRRFMPWSDLIFIANYNKPMIYEKELMMVKKYNLDYHILSKGEYITYHKIFNLKPELL